MADTADVIKESAAAVPVVSQNFAVVVAVVALLGVGLLVWRDETRADAQINVLRDMGQAIRDLDGDLKDHGVQTGQTKLKRLQAQTAAGVAP